MPAYLCHGFRWSRKSIQIFIILQNIDEAAPGWIMAPKGAAALLDTFYKQFDFLPPCYPPSSSSGFGAQGAYSPEPAMPVQTKGHRRGRRSDEDSWILKGSAKMNGSRTLRMPRPPTRDIPVPPTPPSEPRDDNSSLKGPSFNQWSAVKLVEEYDPANEMTSISPYAYVADYVVRIDTSCPVVDEIMQYEAKRKAGTEKSRGRRAERNAKKGHNQDNAPEWFQKLRDQLEKEEEIRWYVVNCGDEERAVPEEDDEALVFDGAGSDTTSSMGENSIEDEFEPRFPELLDPEFHHTGPASPPLEGRQPPLPLRARARLDPEYEPPPPPDVPPPPPPEKDVPARPPLQPVYNIPPPPPIPEDKPSSRRARSKSPGPARGLRRLFSKRNLKDANDKD